MGVCVTTGDGGMTIGGLPGGDTLDTAPLAVQVPSPGSTMHRKDSPPTPSRGSARADGRRRAHDQAARARAPSGRAESSRTPGPNGLLRPRSDWVFAYGSLLGGPRHPALLTGRRRAWTVAMDNRVALPGYKVYEDRSGRRPPVLVAFLDLVVDASAFVEGGLLRVDADMLGALDRRERQYRRVEVTDRVEGLPPRARVWTYVGRAHSRLRVHRAGAPIVVHDAYARAAAAAGAPPPPFPVRPLRPVDLPR